jgi:hypothetical protein
MLSVIILNVIMPNVMAPKNHFDVWNKQSYFTQIKLNKRSTLKKHNNCFLPTDTFGNTSYGRKVIWSNVLA